MLVEVRRISPPKVERRLREGPFGEEFDAAAAGVALGDVAACVLI
jgi:hypothetical protein